MIHHQPIALACSTLDALHRATEGSTHLTHEAMAFDRQFLRVRSAYTALAFLRIGRLARFSESAHRLRGQVQP